MSVLGKLPTSKLQCLKYVVYQWEIYLHLCQYWWVWHWCIWAYIFCSLLVWVYLWWAPAMNMYWGDHIDQIQPVDIFINFFCKYWPISKNYASNSVNINWIWWIILWIWWILTQTNQWICIFHVLIRSWRWATFLH